MMHNILHTKQELFHSRTTRVAGSDEQNSTAYIYIYIYMPVLQI